MYFVVVTITTVGYGDYMPSADYRFFHLAYIWISLTVVAFCLGILSNDAKQPDWLKLEDSFKDRQHRVYVRIILVYSYIEGWTLTDSLYFASVTAGTIGYGRIVPTTDFSRLVSIFYILVAVLSISNCISTIMQGFYGLHEWRERRQYYSERLRLDRLGSLDTTGEGRVDELSFIEYMLIKTCLVESDDIQEIKEQFYALADKDVCVCVCVCVCLVRVGNLRM
eukprot:GHVR01105301.1.p1 GENE.GHVR01105301.1~~GHVR01105301.1.p1  ORF type:complete len:223 (-),score=43.13 GHVR01105301.1:54-722(-)